MSWQKVSEVYEGQEVSYLINIKAQEYVLGRREVWIRVEIKNYISELVGYQSLHPDINSQRLMFLPHHTRYQEILCG